MEPMARKILTEDPALKVEFEEKLKDDKTFAKAPPRRACNGSTSAGRSTM